MADFIISTLLALLAGGWVLFAFIYLHSKCTTISRITLATLSVAFPVLTWFCVVLSIIAFFGAKMSDCFGMRLLATGGNLAITAVLTIIVPWKDSAKKIICVYVLSVSLLIGWVAKFAI